METIKVNMSPNPLDVQTIHASQNDGEAREWGFALHNNGDAIDSSSISDQLVFKSYKGGTEQILPENGAVPVTAPFVGDIKYPDATRTNQEFLYRQSPTEEDGNAKITDIKGNTLVWNQQIPIPTGQSSVSSGVTVTNNGDGSLTLNGTPSIMNINWWIWGNYATNVSILSLKASHKYFVKDCNLYRETGESLFVQYIGASPVIWSPSADYELGGVRVANGDTSKTYTNVKVYPMIIDLTQMGLDSITADEFTSFFPLSYYSYNQGSLLSFNGNGIKTVGFNQWDEEWEVGAINNNTGQPDTNPNRLRSKNFIPCFPNTAYCLWNGDGINTFMYFYDADKKYIKMGSLTPVNPRVDITPSNCAYIKFRTNDYTVPNYNHNICLNISDTSRNGTYEPYTSSTLSLPISTYFPTGMKSAGDVYDELTETKAINRLIKTVVDGTNKTASYYGVYQTHQLFYVDLFATTYSDYSNMGNLISNHYSTSNTVGMDDKCIRYQAMNNQPNIGRIYWNDDRYTSASAMNTALQSSPLEIVSMAQSETVEAFSVASLVTENAEIPLSNEDGVLIGKCTEQLSENPGFIDAKIKLSDADGECYSNKIQLHVERSPQ